MKYNYSSLRSFIENQKRWYLNKYGQLDWHWYDEGLVWAIQDYRSSCEFTEDDENFLTENGFTKENFEEVN